MWVLGTVAHPEQQVRSSAEPSLLPQQVFKLSPIQSRRGY